MQAHGSQFSYDKDTRTLTAFASDLGIRAGDDLPKEIIVQGHKQQIRFIYKRNEMHGQGEDREVGAFCYHSTMMVNMVFLKLWNT